MKEAAHHNWQEALKLGEKVPIDKLLQDLQDVFNHIRFKDLVVVECVHNDEEDVIDGILPDAIFDLGTLLETERFFRHLGSFNNLFMKGLQTFHNQVYIAKL